jgi:SAM-dependent methyltransferase
MTANETVSWYESGLPARERKTRGHFSTPPALVDQILDACNYTLAHDLSQIRVLDPACGGGNFLAGAARRLLAFSNETNLPKRKRLSLIQRNLWGFDPDPISCFLAEMQLRTLLSTDGSLNERHPSPLHIHQADGLAFPWEQSQPVDFFLANPPYLAAKNNDLSCYRSSWQHGQVDSYLLFLDLALRIVRPGGWIALVLPDPVLARANATHERRALLRETTIHHLWHLSGVFPAYVGAAILIAQKLPPPAMHQIAWRRGRWQRDATIEAVSDAIIPVHASAITQASLYRQPGAEMRYLLSDACSPQHLLARRLHEFLCEVPVKENPVFAPLNSLALIRRGEELSKDNALLLPESTGDGEERYPVLRGGVDLRPYEKPAGRYWIRREAIKKNLERYFQPKLLVVKSTGVLQAALDLDGHIVLQTLYMLLLRTEKAQEDDLYFLLALLNSRLLRTYIYMVQTAYKWVQPQIEQHVLGHLPIPTIATLEKEQIVARTRKLLSACSDLSPVVKLEVESKEGGSKAEREWQAMYEEQERAICVLYQAALTEGRLIPEFPDKGVSYG